MVVKLQDFKLDEQESRLVLFGSTVFKVKCRVSLELRAAVRSNEVRERAIQQDLKVKDFCFFSPSFMLLFLLEGNSCNSVPGF